MASVTKELYQKGALKSAEVDSISHEEAAKLHPWAPLLWGGNCRSVGDRIRSLGWKPVGPTLSASLSNMVEFEIKSFGTQSSAITF
jgi:hypothetical protein